MLDPTVVWPSDDDFEESRPGWPDDAVELLKALVDASYSDEHVEADSEGEDDEDETLPWWPAGVFFGIPDPSVLPLAWQPEPLALADAADAPAASGDRKPLEEEGKGKKVKQGKNVKKEPLGSQDSPLPLQNEGQPGEEDKGIKIEKAKEVKKEHEVEPRRPKHRAAPIPAHKLKMYADYTIKALPGSSRTKVGDEAHAWMVERLKAWQQEEGKDEHEKPFGNEWYFDARVDCIKAGWITAVSGEGVVKSYLNSYVDRLMRGSASAASSKDPANNVD